MLQNEGGEQGILVNRKLITELLKLYTASQWNKKWTANKLIRIIISKNTSYLKLCLVKKIKNKIKNWKGDHFDMKTLIKIISSN